MNKLQLLKSALVSGASVLALANPAAAKVFNIPDGDLATALGAYMQQSGIDIVYLDDVVRGHRSHGAKGEFTETAALTQILQGTGFRAETMPSNAIGIVPEKKKAEEMRVAQAARRAAAAPASTMPATVETVVVTAQKKSENIQNVPIAVTALSQAQLTERQIAGGPDLVKEVPNLTFSKTNFTGYNIEIRGIGTQAISVTTDPAVAVAFNSTPFIRNHFFEQEFYDLQDVEVLRGPQGTLYGRNATAGVVNVKSALPTDQYEAMLSADLGNFSNRRLEGMLNLPIVGDKLDLRIAGEWTKRDGYSFNEITGKPIDGRDLWSGRVTLGWKPAPNVQVDLVWEHFQENDDRMRTAKQLCKTDPIPTEINGTPVTIDYGGPFAPGNQLSQGCRMSSLYSADAFEVPNGFSLPYYSELSGLYVPVRHYFDPYASTTQSQNLRVIESSLEPVYKAKNDTLEFNTDYAISPALTFTSQTGYNQDFLWSTEDYNRFNTAPGAFEYQPGDPSVVPGMIQPDPNGLGLCPAGNPVNPAPGCNGDPSTGGQVCNVGEPGCIADGIFCDPQLGCNDRLVAQDLSEEHAWQLSQEFRLASNFSGPFNFSFGGNFLHYETKENYYVFVNTLTMYSIQVGASGHPGNPWVPGVSDNSFCLLNFRGFGYINPKSGDSSSPLNNCPYIDPNPIGSLNGQGHNYFLSQNPYVLNSYAGFGEAYYNLTNDLKLTGGLRWTVDQKHFIDIPSELVIAGYGYPRSGVVDQQWDQWTGRFAANWTPRLDFTDQTLLYASYAHGYKAGGANPPGAVLIGVSTPIHPLTFKPEHIEAFELGTKNTLLNGALTLNGDIFFYNYHDYQISEIVDRSAINLNFNATVHGAELESTWEPLPGLKLNFAGGYEGSRIGSGSQAVDLIDRTAGNPNWMVVKPFVTESSNCILPTYVVLYQITSGLADGEVRGDCEFAYSQHLDPVTQQPYTPNPTGTFLGVYIPPGAYPGFDPLTAQNNGEGFSKDLGGKQLPNAPHFTTSLSAEYTMPVSDDWAATLHSDFYWQSQSWARVFNDNPYDKIHGYSNVNLALILTSDNGWQVMGYVKNIFDITAITGTFLNSDDSGLTTNVFLTDPRLYGVRVTKQLDQNDGFWGSDYNGYDFFTGLLSDTDNGKPPLWIELRVQSEIVNGLGAPYIPPFTPEIVGDGFTSPAKAQHALSQSFGEEGTISFQPDDSEWIVSATVRFGRASGGGLRHEQTKGGPRKVVVGSNSGFLTPSKTRFSESRVDNSETHTIMDFQAGKDVGLGLFGGDVHGTLAAGVRMAQFTSIRNLGMHADPDFYFPSKIFKYDIHHHTYTVLSHAKRTFHGVGPTISWKASTPVIGNPDNEGISLDWGVNVGLLFGRQVARGHHQTTGVYYKGKFFFSSKAAVSNIHRSGSFDRARTVAAPNIGAFAGVSWRYRNAKVSFGYRADEFFGAMDGGIDTRRNENVGFFGPYANISIGLGG